MKKGIRFSQVKRGKKDVSKKPNALFVLAAVAAALAVVVPIHPR